MEFNLGQDFSDNENCENSISSFEITFKSDYKDYEIDFSFMKKNTILNSNQFNENTKDNTNKYSEYLFITFINKIKTLILKSFLIQFSNYLNKRKQKKYVKKDKKKKKKPGRKKIENEENNNEEKICHTKKSQDNIIRKIRIKAIKFSILLLNDCLKKEMKNRQTIKLRNLTSEVTSNITINFNNEKFMNLTLEEIFKKYPISNEYKTVESDKNQKEVQRIIKNPNLPLSNKLLRKTFKQLFIMFRDASINSLKKYGLNKAQNFNMFISSLDEPKEYKDDLREGANNFFNFFNPKNARKTRKTNLY